MEKDPSTGRVVRDDLTGQVHSNGTTAISFHCKTGNGGSKWVLRCTCGTEFVAWAERFKSGVVCRNCRNEKLREARTMHGMKYSPEYSNWNAMMDRCYNKNSVNYPMWGGRGITVCERWHKFENFFADMGKRPSPNHSLHRVNDAMVYGPGTVVWATGKEHANDRRTSKFITFNGETLTYSQWSEKTGIDKTTIRKRALKGWPPEKILSKEDGRTSYTLTHNGKTQTLMEWVKETGIPKSTLINRLRRGLQGDELFAT